MEDEFKSLEDKNKWLNHRNKLLETANEDLKVKQIENSREEMNKFEVVKEEEHFCYKCDFKGNSKDEVKKHVIATHMRK